MLLKAPKSKSFLSHGFNACMYLKKIKIVLLFFSITITMLKILTLEKPVISADWAGRLSIRTRISPLGGIEFERVVRRVCRDRTGDRDCPIRGPRAPLALSAAAARWSVLGAVRPGAAQQHGARHGHPYVDVLRGGGNHDALANRGGRACGAYTDSGHRRRSGHAQEADAQTENVQRTLQGHPHSGRLCVSAGWWQ